MIHGWYSNLEDWDYLDSLPDGSECVAMMGDYPELAFDPRQLLKVENQGGVGSCAGHSLTTNIEYIYALATGGQSIQLSRAMAYYETQRIDGIRGDNGSTISGGVKLAKSIGVCREELWPYRAVYDNRRPQNFEAVKADAANYRIARDVRLKNYDQIRAWLGSGQGGAHTGFPWSRSYEAAVVEQGNRHVVGGHSEAWICLSNRKDGSGRPYVWAIGSYSTRSGNNGWREFNPGFVDWITSQRGSAFVGLSDMPNIQPREFTAEDWIKVLRW